LHKTITQKLFKLISMKKFLILLLISVLINAAFAQQASVDCTGTVKSAMLKKEMPYSVFLPPSYQTSNRQYPVLYLLHGAWDNYMAWVLKGDLLHIASKMMESGEIPEMIIVTPEGLTDAFYINNFDKSVLWEDFFHQEFIPAIEQKYRIVADRKFRAISGLSMGGYGSLYHGLKYKDKFCAIYALSAAVIEINANEPQNKPNEMYKKLWGPNASDGFPQNYKVHSIQEMVKSLENYQPTNYPAALEVNKLPKITLDCGDDDFLLLQNLHLAELLKVKTIPFELRIRDGAHTWDYWRSGLELALISVSKSFRNP